MVASGVFGEVPGEKELEHIKNSQASVILSADGQEIGHFYIQQRTPTKYKHISEAVINALIATEDARFYQHEGIDFRSLLRVLFKTILLQDRSGGGGSTIHMQLAKNLYPRKDHGLFHIAVSKVKEGLIAYRLEKTYSKEEILTLYLNTVPFGENIYGIEMAANRFFSKSAQSLQAHEAALLIGMLKANYTYNPRLFPENALARRNTVLSQMHKYDYLREDSLLLLQQKPLDLNYNRITGSDGPAPYFREQLRGKIEAWCAANLKDDGTPYNVYADGLRIHTTIDSRLQTYVKKAVDAHMKSLQATFNEHWKGQQPWSHNPDLFTKAVKQSPAYKKWQKQGLSHTEIMTAMSKSYPMTLFTWEGEQERNASPLDSIRHYLQILQTGVVAMDPENGAVKAWVGGIDHKYFKYDHAKATTRRQVGSTFKPFVYAAALEGGIDPCDYISGRKTRYTNLANWTPDNADTSENKLKYSFRGALAHSVNTVSVKLLEEVGISRTIDLAQKAGIQAELPQVPSLALGTADISLIEMATAYSALANGGYSISPYFINRIENAEGEVLYQAPEQEKERIMQSATAQTMNHLLQFVVDEGTAGRLRWKYNLSNELAGKTGTTQANADGWFIGYNPKLVMAVWVGADNPGIRFRSTALGSGANMALPIFGQTFQHINKDRQLQTIAQAKFESLPPRLAKKLACEPFKEDRNFFERLLNTDLTKDEKARKFNDKEEKDDEEEKDKKGFFKKIGELFKKKDDGGDNN